MARIGITSSPIHHEGLALESVNVAYVDAVVHAGGMPVLLPVLAPELAATALDGVDGLLLSGGGDIDPRAYGAVPVEEVYGVDRRRDAYELALAHAALDQNLPVLGICRGHQLLNVALGGTLIQHVPELTEFNHQEKERFAEVIHHVRVDPDSLVASVLGTDQLGVNTLHHQAVAQPGAGLRVVATSDDGLIEAVEHEDRRVIGVQWHPELLQVRTDQRRLVEWLVDEAEARHRLAEQAGLPAGSGPDATSPAALT
jgi:putative glutamine amidotransferase